MGAQQEEEEEEGLIPWIWQYKYCKIDLPHATRDLYNPRALTYFSVLMDFT